MTDQPHGTPRGYRACVRRPEGSCQACRDSVAREKRRRDWERMNGQEFFTSPDKTMAHILMLKASGMGVNAICVAAKISTSTMHELRHGLRTRVTLTTEARVLAVEPRPKRVHPGGTVARIKAMLALGYSYTVMDTMTGCYPRLNRQKYYERPLVLALIEMCREVGDTPGPSEITRKRALTRGFRIPAWYDEDDFFDPQWEGPPKRVHSSKRKPKPVICTAEFNGLLTLGKAA